MHENNSIEQEIQESESMGLGVLLNGNLWFGVVKIAKHSG
jgi:hypothetical protein